LTVLLAISAGLPYFVLSSTGPLLQSWFTRTHPGRMPYRLYSLSNLGSLLGLLTYPFLVEPWFSLRTQARIWTIDFSSLPSSAATALCGWEESPPYRNLLPCAWPLSTLWMLTPCRRTLLGEAT